MIKLEEALTIIQRYTRVENSERTGLVTAMNRVLAEDIFSDMDMPPFNKSAVDGYAFRLVDFDETLDIIESVPAGSSPLKTVSHGQCTKIMTGAPVPAGADCVVMIEDTEISNNRIRILQKPGKSNICLLGEDVRKGDLVIEKGTVLKPQHISVLASSGHVMPEVYKQPQITIIVTGNELVEPDTVPPGSKIRNSNGYQLISQGTSSGCKTTYYGIIKDDIRDLKIAVESAFRLSDILVITGGASKGDFDLIPHIMEQLGFNVHITEVAIQPGKPFNFSTRNNLICFGLSGNPVSSFVQFELLVKPFLNAKSGIIKKPVSLKLPLSKSVSRKKTERAFFFPVAISADAIVSPLEFHGSAHSTALVNADGIASVPPGIKQLKKGENVDVRPF